MPLEFCISSLEMYISKLEIHIFSLEMYIFRLEMKNLSGIGELSPAYRRVFP